MGGRTDTPASVTSLSFSWCPSCSTGEWIGTVCRNSWLVCSCVCPTVVPRELNPLSWKRPCCDPASEYRSHGAVVRTRAPWGTAIGVCVSLHCLPSDWKELWPHCCYWLWAQIPPHLHLKHVGFPLISKGTRNIQTKMLNMTCFTYGWISAENLILNCTIDMIRWKFVSSRTRIVQSVQCLATSWSVRALNPGGEEIFLTPPNWPWGNPASCRMDTRSSLSVNCWSVVSTNHPLLAMRLRKSTSILCLHGLLRGELYLLTAYRKWIHKLKLWAQHTRWKMERRK